MLEFLTQVDVDDNGRTGSIRGLNYTQMVRLLGEPNRQDDADKVDASWAVADERGTVIAVWNYKNGTAYNPDDGLTLDDIWDWSLWAETEEQKELARRIFREAAEVELCLG